MNAGRSVPLPDLGDPRVGPFYAAASRGELAVPRCTSCGRFVWYPAEECPRCGGSDHPWVALSGRGTLFSWAVVRRPFHPAYEDLVPFVAGLVAIVEDPAVRLVTRVVDAEPDRLVPDMAMIVTFRCFRGPGAPPDLLAPMFRPDDTHGA